MTSVKQTSVLVACLAWLPLAPGVAGAQDSIRVGTVSASAGDRRVVVPIQADTSQVLTLLSLDLVFDASLCAHIENSSIETTGRTLGEAQEGGLKCPGEGRIRVVLLDLSGTSVLPSGSGAVVHWSFDLKDSAPTGVFPLGINLAQASNGPAPVALVVEGGELAIGTFLCVGDCDESGHVSIDELVRGVEIGLGKQDLDSCPAIDGTGDGFVSVADLVAGVNAGLRGCPAAR